MAETPGGALDVHSPSAVGLTRLSARLAFPAGGESVYRSVLRLVEMNGESEFLIVPCGRGRSARFVAETTGATGAGADPDEELVAVATARAKSKRLGARLHFESAPLHDLPYQDAVFDVAFGEIELAAAQDPPAALRELVRVTRPGGFVVLIQLVWLRALDDERRDSLVDRLGVRPHLLAEWKQMLRDAGVTDVVIEDWADTAGADRRPAVLGGLTELFTPRGKMRILPRAWKRWGWRGVRAVLSRERELRGLLEEERVLGVIVVRGRVAEAMTTENGEEREGHNE